MSKIYKPNGTVNHLLAFWQEQGPVVKSQKPQPMKTKKSPSVLKKFLRDIPIIRNTLPVLLTQDEFCRLLSITRETAAEWRRTRGIPYIHLPNRIYYRAEDVQDFLDRHTVLKTSDEL